MGVSKGEAVIVVRASELAARPVPAPRVDITIRPAVMEDFAFMDTLQRKTTRQVGWMPTKPFEGKIAAGHMLIAEANGYEPEALATVHRLPGMPMPVADASGPSRRKRAAKGAVVVAAAPKVIRRNGLMFDIPRPGEPVPEDKPAPAA